MCDKPPHAFRNTVSQSRSNELFVYVRFFSNSACRRWRSVRPCLRLGTHVAGAALAPARPRPGGKYSPSGRLQPCWRICRDLMRRANGAFSTLLRSHLTARVAAKAPGIRLRGTGRAARSPQIDGAQDTWARSRGARRRSPSERFVHGLSDPCRVRHGLIGLWMGAVLAQGGSAKCRAELGRGASAAPFQGRFRRQPGLAT